MRSKNTLNKTATEWTLISLVFLLLIFPAYISGQSTRDVIAGYVGWDGNPDSLTVYIDNSFTDAEKADVREGMKRWNDAGGKPKFKEVASPPAKITVKEGDPGAGNAGIAAITTDANGKNTSVEITIKNNPNPSLKETATHELGHAIGLDDTDATKNPGDVMKGTGNSNGTDGGLSKHDSTELKAAIAAITTPAPPPAGVKPIKKRALAPPMAIQPGQSGILQFDLDFFFPPFSNAIVTPTGDDLVQVNGSELNGNMLFADITILPGHGSGKFYLDIEIHGAFPGSPIFYLGEHFVNSNPLPPLTFQCSASIYEEDGKVHVDWKNYHNYPNPSQPLRAHLTIDGEIHYLAKGGDDYVIDLEPGLHIFTLELDDFQNNSSTFTAAYQVNGNPQNVPLSNWAIMIGIVLIILIAWFRLRGIRG